MKKVRLFCLLLTLGLIWARPGMIRAASCGDGGCNDFATWCDGFCYNHGGTALCNYNVGMGCSDLCYCGDDTIYEDRSGYCPPCPSA